LLFAATLRRLGIALHGRPNWVGHIILASRQVTVLSPEHRVLFTIHILLPLFILKYQMTDKVHKTNNLKRDIPLSEPYGKTFQVCMCIPALIRVFKHLHILPAGIWISFSIVSSVTLSGRFIHFCVHLF
jgi:hypothetical protein